MRVALAQINPILGDFQVNAKKIIEYSQRAKEKHADIVVFPEASLFGYHPMDLLERPSIIDQQLKVLNKLLKSLPKDMLIIFGAFTKNTKKKGKPYFNSAIVTLNGKIIKQSGKELLPTYNVFDDARHIEPGNMSKNIFTYKKKKMLLTVCEDIWAWPMAGRDSESYYPFNPIKKIKPREVDFVINLSASPFYIGKAEQRLHVVKKTAGHLKAPMVYVNMVGAQDELVFDGGSFAVSATGKVLAKSMHFEEDLNIVDFNEKSGGLRKQDLSDIESMRRALVLGVRDFCDKIRIKRVHLGLSGGIDSAVVAAIAADALGPANVTCFAMPGPFSTDKSFKLAEQLAKNLGVDFQTMSISESYDAVLKSFENKLGHEQFGLTEENLQSRLRGLLLMAFSNRTNSLLLNTSNKTELASGYGTLYGDMIGGLCVIGDLVKRDVYALAVHYNVESEIIPNEIITRPPSAELKPNQKDEDSLPPYKKLDTAVVNLIEHMQPAKKPEEKFLLQAMLRSEFKRWQAPPILKIRERSFGRGRRMPVAHRATD